MNIYIYIYESYFGIETYSISISYFKKEKKWLERCRNRHRFAGPASRPCGRHWPPSPSPLAGPRSFGWRNHRTVRLMSHSYVSLLENTRPGELLHSELENHHVLAGKIHYFNGHFQ